MPSSAGSRERRSARAIHSPPRPSELTSAWSPSRSSPIFEGYPSKMGLLLEG